MEVDRRTFIGTAFESAEQFRHAMEIDEETRIEQTAENRQRRVLLIL